MNKDLARWPLLLVGLTVLGFAVALFGDREDPSDARALLLGLGCVMVGAGIVLVAWGKPGPPPGQGDDDG